MDLVHFPEWTIDRKRSLIKRISANSNSNPNPNPKSQKRLRKSEMMSIFGQVSRI